MSWNIYNSRGDFVSISKRDTAADAVTIVIPKQHSIHISHGHHVNYAIKSALVALTAAVAAYIAIGTDIDAFFWIMCAFFMSCIVKLPLRQGFVPSLGATKITVEPKFFSEMKGDEDVNYRHYWKQNDIRDIISLLYSDETRDDMISLLYAAQDRYIDIWDCRETFNNMKTVGLTYDNYRYREIDKLIEKYYHQANAMRTIQSEII